MNLMPLLLFHFIVIYLFKIMEVLILRTRSQWMQKFLFLILESGQYIT